MLNFGHPQCNGLISAYFLTDKKEEEEFYLYSEFCIRFEQIFSLFQMIKILDFMGLTYRNLYDNDNISNSIRRYLFKEKTNVFAYYIIKNVLLYNNAEFLVLRGSRIPVLGANVNI